MRRVKHQHDRGETVMRVPGWLVVVSIIGWLGVTVVGAAGAFVGARAFVIQAGDAIPLPELRLNTANQPTAVAVEPTALPTATTPPAVAGQPTFTPAPTLVTSPTLPPQDDNALVRGALSRLGPRKITVLLLGIDQRSAVESGDNEYFRTDTMIVLQLDPVRRTAGMLSIPRDLYVEIPGFTASRINTANYLGDANRYPGGGPALAMLTVKEVLGLEVDYYVLVNFDVFTTVVDTVAPSGVEVCVQEPIYDPDYPDEGYGTIEVRFDPGCERMDAERLLQYARTRATQGSDFDRARRQQQVITSIQSEVVSAGGLVNLVTRAPALWTQLSANLRTDMTFEQALDLALVSTTIDPDDIQTGVIDNRYVTFEKDDTNADILIPVPSSISVLIQDTFNPTGDLTRDDLRERAAAESASIAVLNNTTTQGLAGTTRDWLGTQGVSISTIGNTSNPNGADTIIRDYTGNPWTARYLAEVLGIPRERILAGVNSEISADIAILVGPDINALMGG
jgi:LCP family protein required for cell wall assembly